MPRRWIIAVVVCVAIPVFATNAQAQGNGDVSAQDETCDFLFNNGAGITNFDWCLTSNGNITKFESPEGAEHIMVGGFIEGYAVCSTQGGQSGRDFAQAVQIAGFGPTINLGCGGTGCKFQRDTLDGRFRLVMEVKGDKKLHAINISTTVTNLSAVPLDNVQIIRYVDADMDNDFPDDRGDKSFEGAGIGRSAWARDVNALTLTATTFKSGIIPYSRLEDDIGPVGTCNPANAYLPPAGPVDIGLLVGYNVGTLNPGKSAKVSFQLQRQ